MKDLVLVGTVHIDNGWYGDNKRVILSVSDGTGFVRKGDARKYATRLKKYVNSIFENRAMAGAKLHVSIDCDERESFVSYQYVSAGPSISYQHIDITVEQLLSFESQ